jgi:hypothetical protein
MSQTGKLDDKAAAARHFAPSPSPSDLAPKRPVADVNQIAMILVVQDGGDVNRAEPSSPKRFAALGLLRYRLYGRIRGFGWVKKPSPPPRVDAEAKLFGEIHRRPV